MAVLKMWGNSAALRIPAATLDAANFRLDQELELRAEVGRIVIESRVPAYSLDDLVAAMTPENTPTFHPSAQAVGGEVIEW
jgi:antitoxin MazE